jgi:uncharacterized protein (TIGR03382 family)
LTLMGGVGFCADGGGVFMMGGCGSGSWLRRRRRGFDSGAWLWW